METTSIIETGTPSDLIALLDRHERQMEAHLKALRATAAEADRLSTRRVAA